MSTEELKIKSDIELACRTAAAELGEKLLEMSWFSRNFRKSFNFAPSTKAA